MSLPYRSDLIKKAKNLRKNATRHERHLWYAFLRDYPVRFQRQKAIADFIADFYCSSAKLVIELDGSQHYSDEGLLHDEKRSAALKANGLEVLRFSNREIDMEFRAVCEKIDLTVKERTAHK